MTLTSARLVDGAREIVLLSRTNFRRDLILQKIDAPSPAVRAVSEARTDADGEDDTTTRHGARAVSVELKLFDHPGQLIDELNGYLHPSARPWLHLVDDEWPAGERRIRLRVNQFSSPIGTGRGLRRDVQLQWQAPDGIWEATEPTELVIAADTGLVDGRVYPFTEPRAYPATSAAGVVEHTNPGNTWQDQTVRLYGPCAGPRYTNDLTGEVLEFSEELTIGPGEYLELDTRERTALLMSDPDASRLHLMNFEVSTWWRLAPGLNRLRYNPISGVEVGARAYVTYHPAWL